MCTLFSVAMRSRHAQIGKIRKAMQSEEHVDAVGSPCSRISPWLEMPDGIGHCHERKKCQVIGRGRTLVERPQAREQDCSQIQNGCRTLGRQRAHTHLLQSCVVRQDPSPLAPARCHGVAGRVRPKLGQAHTNQKHLHQWLRGKARHALRRVRHLRRQERQKARDLLAGRG